MRTGECDVRAVTDGARDFCRWTLECDSCERFEVDRCSPISSFTEDASDATEGARRSTGDGSSGTAGVTLFLCCFLLVKRVGFLPNIELDGEGEGSGIMQMASPEGQGDFGKGC